MGVAEFIDEVTQEIERIGITAGNVATIAAKHGVQEDGSFYPIPGYNHTYFLWGITEEAGRAFINLLNDRDDFTATLCNPALVLVCGGPIPIKMPMAKKIYNYKTDHWLPVYFDKKRGNNS